jgi:transcriptional regulator with XRE-family HTH domain
MRTTTSSFASCGKHVYAPCMRTIHGHRTEVKRHVKVSATHAVETHTLVRDLAQQLERAKIKARIKQAREEAGLTQPELGDLMVPPAHMRTVQDWESTTVATVPFRHLPRIAEVTGRSTSWLLHGAEQPPEEFATLMDELRSAAESFQSAAKSLVESAIRVERAAEKLELRRDGHMQPSGG